MDPAFLTAQAVGVMGQLLLDQHRLGGPPLTHTAWRGRPAFRGPPTGPPAANHQRQVEIIRAIQAKLDEASRSPFPVVFLAWSCLPLAP